jgi:anti-sigma-K factor RskA
MKSLDPNLRELLAAEHVLGTHSARVRSRFARLLKEDARLRNTVEEWEARLNPLILTLTEVEPSARVWKAIQQRIGKREPSRALNFWRLLAFLSTAAAMALLIYIGVAPRTEPEPYMLAVMSDSSAQPMLVATMPEKDKGELNLRILAHHYMAADTSWELWCLPGAGKPPMSMGLVTTDVLQTVPLTDAQIRVLENAEALAISLEPKGGSPTGAPTGPVLMSGPIVKI